MNGQKKKEDKLLEELIRRAGEEWEAQDRDGFEEIEGEIVFSERHKKTMEKIFRKERRNERIKEISKIAAIIVVIFIGVSAIKTPQSYAWLSNIINFVFEKDQPNTDYNFRTDKGCSYSDDNVIMNYIPMGFEMVDNAESDRGFTLFFENGEQYFQFSRKDLNVSFSVDSEVGETTETTVNDCKGIYIQSKNINSLIWSDEEFAYNIAGNISQEELKKIGENILN